jgi:hypothetical protein
MSAKALIAGGAGQMALPTVACKLLSRRNTLAMARHSDADRGRMYAAFRIP